MPPQHRALANLSLNTVHNHELSLYKRGLIAGGAWAGARPAYIAQAFDFARFDCQNTLNLDPLRDDRES